MIKKMNSNSMEHVQKQHFSFNSRKGSSPSELFVLMGMVTPLYKKDDEFCKINYRPVTVLPALNNIFEGFYRGRCMNFTMDSYQTS